MPREVLNESPKYDGRLVIGKKKKKIRGPGTPVLSEIKQEARKVCEQYVSDKGSLTPLRSDFIETNLKNG